MTVGALVEKLIAIRDYYRGDIPLEYDNAMCDACNLLDALPIDMEVRDAMTTLKKFGKEIDKYGNRYEYTYR